MTGNTAQRWGTVQIALHWTIAAMILIQVPVGFAMVGESPGPTQNALYNIHKNLGVLVFLLALARLAWRLAHPVPLLPSDLPTWQATAARATHFLLYALLLAMPLTGFLYTALGGFPVPLLMAWDVAKLLPVNKPLAEWFQLAHLSLQWLLYATVAVHVTAAYHHHLVRKDWVLSRMMSSTQPLDDAGPERSPARKPA